MNRGRSGSHSRKYGYKLTPGTVKYAAFHVVSAQGPNGLSITEIADRIEVFINVTSYRHGINPGCLQLAHLANLQRVFFLLLEIWFARSFNKQDS